MAAMSQIMNESSTEVGVAFGGSRKIGANCSNVKAQSKVYFKFNPTTLLSCLILILFVFIVVVVCCLSAFGAQCGEDLAPNRASQTGKEKATRITHERKRRKEKRRNHLNTTTHTVRHTYRL